MRGDCVKRGVSKGYGGLAPQLDCVVHTDHNTEEGGNVPPIGRGLEARLGVESRQSAIAKQGGAACLALLRGMNTPKRGVNRDRVQEDVPYSPIGGEEPLDWSLETVLEGIKDLYKRGDVEGATRAIDKAIAYAPHWGVLMRAVSEVYTHGGRHTPPAEGMDD